MADNRREKDKRFYFSRGQLVILAFGFAVASVIIFFLGMLTGKGIEERKFVKAEEPLVKIPAGSARPGSASAPGGQAREELTFYDTLTKTPEPAAKEAEKEPKRPEKTAKAEIKETKPAEKAPEKPVEQAVAVPDTTASAASAPDKPWSVQVNAFPDQRSARIWVDRLNNKGYNAYMVEANIRGRTWHRVRVGHYATREEAEKVEDMLQKKEKLTAAFATSR